ncbi:uncharacterized protein LOC134457626 [Engraulis encrasicolus]|uniref:uncharacterized protein LOC134457626 n=1 Tax=Engraulis encrasicolus TaxID=184585 RepID=UPI002FD437F7
MSALCTWCPICAKESQDAIPDQLQQLLPEGYCHSLCTFKEVESGFTATVKLKCTTVEEAKKWLKDFQESSRVTLRICKTYSEVKNYRRNAFRVDMKCQHNTGHRSYTKRNTYCPAQLYLVLKRARDGNNKKTRSTDPHIHQGFLMFVTIKHHHNHTLASQWALGQRDVSKETMKKLEVLFQGGHSPSSALTFLKQSLQLEHGDGYQKAVADRALCPDIYFCYRLYYSLYKREYSADAEAKTKNPQENQEEEAVVKTTQVSSQEAYNDEQRGACAQIESMAAADDGHGSHSLVGPHGGAVVVIDSVTGTQEEATDMTHLLLPPQDSGEEAEPFENDEDLEEEGHFQGHLQGHREGHGANSFRNELNVANLESSLASLCDVLKDKLRRDPSARASITSFVSSFWKIQNYDKRLLSALSAFGKPRRRSTSAAAAARTHNIQTQNPRWSLPLAAKMNTLLPTQRTSPLGGRKRKHVSTGRPRGRPLGLKVKKKKSEGQPRAPVHDPECRCGLCLRNGDTDGQHS